MKHIIAGETRKFETSVYMLIAWYYPLGWPKKHSTASLFSGILDGSSRRSETGIGDWERTWTVIDIPIIIDVIAINFHIRCGWVQLARGNLQNLWELGEVCRISDSPRCLPLHSPEGVPQTSYKLQPLNHFSPKQGQLNSGGCQYSTYPLATATPNIVII